VKCHLELHTDVTVHYIADDVARDGGGLPQVCASSGRWRRSDPRLLL